MFIGKNKIHHNFMKILIIKEHHRNLGLGVLLSI